MELALELGFNTVAALEGEMSVEEFEQWGIYARKNLLPKRRMEYYMAQLTLQVSHLGRMWGGPAYGLFDFLFEKQAKDVVRQDTTETGAAAIGAIVGGIKVIKLGQKRRKIK